MREINVLAAIVLVSVGAAQRGLPLKHGTYVSQDTACTNAPFAAIQYVDQKGIQYPHLRGCKALVTAKYGSTYDLTQTCASGEHDVLRLTILNSATYSVGSGSEVTVFRFCSQRPY